MATATRGIGRTVWVATRAMLLITLLWGVVYTIVMTGIAQLAFPEQANGSIITTADGRQVGSRFIGQLYTDADGNPLPQYFQSRPSAAGDGYDGGASSGSNWGPENPDFIQAVEDRRAQVAEFNDVDPALVPPDALTASGSGLDPHISPEYAEIQIARVAEARGMSEDELRAIVKDHTKEPDLGYLGGAVVNVLELNVALDDMKG